MPTVIHIIDQNLPVYATGNQTITGVKEFRNRPTVNGTGILLSGEVPGPIGATGPRGATGPQGFVGSTGPQGFVGSTGPQGFVGSTGPQGLLDGAQTINGVKNFTSRPTVNSTGVLLQGEVAQADLSSTVRTTGDQTISGAKFFSSGGGGYFKSELIYTNSSATLKLRDNPLDTAQLPLNTLYLNSVSPFETTTANANTTGYKIFWNFTNDNREELSRHIRTQMSIFETGLHPLLGPWVTVAQNVQNSTGIIIPGFPNRNISPRASFLNYSLEDRLAHIEKNGVFSLLSGEKMGIGIHNPSEKLHVVGNLKLDGELQTSQRPIINGLPVIISSDLPFTLSYSFRGAYSLNRLYFPFFVPGVGQLSFNPPPVVNINIVNNTNIHTQAMTYLTSVQNIQTTGFDLECYTWNLATNGIFGGIASGLHFNPDQNLRLYATIYRQAPIPVN